MKKEKIIEAIEGKVGGASHSFWHIGLTHDVAERKKYWKETEKKNVEHWSDWQAESLSEAETIEALFIERGMIGGTGGDLSRWKITYVYVF
jgi:hypothetical protein